MNAYDKLKQLEQENNSILCVGLDVDIDKMPTPIEKSIEGILKFNQEIIDSTKDLVSSYKVNFAFYEQYGIRGFELLKKTINSIPKNIHIIADAKRGDIGNTSRAYAKAVFDEFECDSITVSPYMGEDSVKPFLEYKNKMVFLLCLTSNSGASDFEKQVIEGKPLYEIVMEKSLGWNENSNLAYVVGATQPDELKRLRQITTNSYFLIPGIGAQGGDVQEVMKSNDGGNAIINSSRSIIYASRNNDFAEKVRQAALMLKDKLNENRY